MFDPDIRNQLRPITRSWPWFLAAGSGAVAFGVLSVVYALFVAVAVGKHDMAFFWEIMDLPLGVLAVLCGYQLIRIARNLAASLGSHSLYDVAEFFRRLRLVVVYGGSMSLLMLFWYLSALVREVVLTP
jgi:hypothetical protein